MERAGRVGNPNGPGGGFLWGDKLWEMAGAARRKRLCKSGQRWEAQTGEHRTPPREGLGQHSRAWRPASVKKEEP